MKPNRKPRYKTWTFIAVVGEYDVWRQETPHWIAVTSPAGQWYGFNINNPSLSKMPSHAYLSEEVQDFIHAYCGMQGAQHEHR